MAELEKEKIPFKQRLVLALVPVASLLIWLIGMTMRIRLVDPHQVAPQAKPQRNFIYAFWHNQQILSTFFFRNSQARVLVSRSRDGELIARALEWFGFKTVRSSSSSGKVNALRGLARELRTGHHAAITPDGPRGPVYQAQPGAVFLAALSRHPVVPIGSATDRAWRLSRSWDQFEIPKPFGRAVIVFDKPLEVPAKLDERQTREWTERLQTRMNDLRARARDGLHRSESRESHKG